MKPIDVPFCCACGKVKDEVSPKAGQGQWVELRAYKMRYGLCFVDLHLIQTYCAECAELLRCLSRSLTEPLAGKGRKHGGQGHFENTETG